METGSWACFEGMYPLQDSGVERKRTCSLERLEWSLHALTSRWPCLCSKSGDVYRKDVISDRETIPDSSASTNAKSRSACARNRPSKRLPCGHGLLRHTVTDTPPWQSDTPSFILSCRVPPVRGVETPRTIDGLHVFQFPRISGEAIVLAYSVTNAVKCRSVISVGTHEPLL